MRVVGQVIVWHLSHESRRSNGVAPAVPVGGQSVGCYLNNAKSEHLANYGRSCGIAGAGSAAQCVVQRSLSHFEPGCGFLVATTIDLEARLTDAVLYMADKLIGGLFARARNTTRRRYAASAGDRGARGGTGQ